MTHSRMGLTLYLAATISILLFVNWFKEWVTRPKNVPPVYSEFPYIPWLGSIVQFAIQPREFLQRAHAAMGDIFTINLFGWSMTFLMSSEGSDLLSSPHSLFVTIHAILN